MKITETQYNKLPEDLKSYFIKHEIRTKSKTEHPTVKPISLMEYLIKMVCPKGGTVLDPFAGSGTTGEAAVKNGFYPILIEKDTEYCKDIQGRMNKFIGNPLFELFGEE